MNRYFVLLLALSWPLGADAFSSFTRNIDGATITAQRSATEPCGVDLDIKLKDNDQRFVIIEYTYSGTFDSGTYSGVYRGGLNPPLLSAGSRSGVINVQMGGLLELSSLIIADPKGLYCSRGWSFNFIASTINNSQGQRNQQNERKRKEQERTDEQNRRKAEQAEQKRKSQQQQQDHLAERERERIRGVMSHHDMGACLGINPYSTRSEINQCEQIKAGIRDEKEKREAQEATAALEARRKRDAEERSAAEQAARQREMEIDSARMKANPCAFAEEQARLMPQKIQQIESQSSSNPTQKQVVAAQVAQLRQWLSAVEAQCTASRSQTQNTAPRAQTVTPQSQASQPQAQETNDQRNVRTLLELLENAKKLGWVK